MSEIMKRWWKSPRDIVVGERVYRWSLLDRPQYRELAGLVLHQDRNGLFHSSPSFFQKIPV